MFKECYGCSSPNWCRQNRVCNTRNPDPLSPAAIIEAAEQEFVLVPKELTPAMHEAGLRFAGTLHANYEDLWKAMIAAAVVSR